MTPDEARTKAGEAVIENIGSLADAVAALEACPARRVVLASPPGAALTLGPLFFRALMDLAAARFPDRTICGRLDCADRPGLAMAALRHGLDAAVATDDDRFARLQAMARASGRRLVRKCGPDGPQACMLPAGTSGRHPGEDDGDDCADTR